MTRHHGKRMNNILIILRKVIIYGDVNDQLALDIIAGLYPTRKVVGINCLNLAMFGGMLHCVTQQQPSLDAIISAN